MRIFRLTMLVASLLIGGLCLAAVEGPAKAPRKDLPTDQHRRHVERISEGKHAYTVRFGGNIDGVMTRMPISYSAYKQGWEPNIRARIENVGDTDVVNPWLTANGTGDWRTVAKIAEEATRGCRTDADKARAIWEWTRSHRFHACTWDGEVSDAVKAMNVYGYTLCGDDALVIADVWKAAGFQVRRGYPVGHCVTEVFYDGDWHLLDGDEHVISLKRDNRTIASEAEVVRDHDLMKRTHTYSIGAADDPLTDQFSASLFGYEGDRSGDNSGHARHQMLFTLRPGESLEWRWNHVGKEYSGGKEPEPGKQGQDGYGPLITWGATAYDNLRNGKWIYSPRLDKPVWEKGTLTAQNVAMREKAVVPQDPANPLKIVWRLDSPYVLVGGSVKCSYDLPEGGLFKISFSTDGKNWQELPQTATPGRNYAYLALDKLLSPRAKPMYQYFIQLEMQGAGCKLSSITFDNDVQMALLAMPELTIGDNAMLYTDETTGPRQVRVTQEWMERTEWHHPSIPILSAPAKGAAVEGTKPTLTWEPASSPDQDVKIADYHVQVCERPDMRWVVSPNFDKLISRTPSKGKTEWTVPYTGLLNPDTTYYWRVRAQDSRGVWGPWSAPRSFQCRAPGVPVNVKVVPDASKGTVDLTWEANPQGRRPVAYKVYGSGEQGFTASDVEYVVKMGRGFPSSMEEYNAKSEKDPGCGNLKTPANFVAKVGEKRMTVVLPVEQPAGSNLNKAWYRVVAVDERGNESGPSDLAPMPRPFIYAKPNVAAKVGEPWACQIGSVSSIGHLTCRNGYNPAFWNYDRISWTLEKAPAWLSVSDTDRPVATLNGLPPAPGQYEIVVKAANNHGQEARQTILIEAK